MINSLKNYIASRDWRIIVIELMSIILAILSAMLLESKFFQIFIADKNYATAFAIIVVAAVTFVAYVVVDNLQKRKRGFSYYAIIVFLIPCYGAIIAALLGMSNYTMAVLKATKDVDKLESKISNVDELPVVVSAKDEMDKTISSCNKEIDRLRGGIDVLIAREKDTGLTYVTKKQEYEKLIVQQNNRIDKTKDEFSRIREKEEARISEQSKTVSTAGKDDGGIGRFLAKNPAILPVLALVVLFIGRLSFTAAQNVTAETFAVTNRETRPVTRPETAVTVSKTTVKHTSVTFSFPLTIEGWQSAIGAIVSELNAGNGKNLVSATARYFDVNKGIVSRAVTHALRGEPINVPTKLLVTNNADQLQTVANETKRDETKEL